MPGSKSAFLEAALADMMLGNTGYSVPSTVYVALSTAPFDPTATGASMTEVTGGSYARVSLANNPTNWPAGAGSAPYVKSNGTPINFATATAGWGTIQSIYILDASSSGNCLYGGDLAAPVTVTTGGSISVPAGSFVVQET